jgi:hypothetical protein
MEIKKITNKILLIIAFVFAASLITGYMAQAQEEKITGDYEWSDPALAKQYSSALWNTITTDRFAGFSAVAVAEKRTEACKAKRDGRDKVSYLRVEGRMCGTGYWLEKPDGEKIDSLEKLIKVFAPVDSEAKAVSFASITNGNSFINPQNIPAGHVLTIPDGFLVQLGLHRGSGTRSTIGTPKGIIFKVARSGDIQKVAEEEEPIPDGPLRVID